MTDNKTVQDNIRLHVGIRSGYRQIERNAAGELVGARQFGRKLRPLPRLHRPIRTAQLAFEYLSSPLLHDLNRMVVMLNVWDEHVHPVPGKELRELVGSMESHIRNLGGRP